MQRNVCTPGAVVGAALLMTGMGLTSANAAPESEDSVPVNGHDLYAQAHAELEAFAASSEVQVQNGTEVVRYTFDGGEQFVLATPQPTDLGDAITPMIGGGTDSRGQYISFNATDQSAIIAGGAAVASGLICLAGPAACVIAGVLVAVSTTYLADGACPGNQELWLYFEQGPVEPIVTYVVCRPVSNPGGG